MPDTHKHRCDSCGCIWQHTREEGKWLPYEAHNCPKCGKRCGMHYHGDKPAEFVDHHLKLEATRA